MPSTVPTTSTNDASAPCTPDEGGRGDGRLRWWGRGWRGGGVGGQGGVGRKRRVGVCTAGGSVSGGGGVGGLVTQPKPAAWRSAKIYPPSLTSTSGGWRPPTVGARVRSRRARRAPNALRRQFGQNRNVNRKTPAVTTAARQRARPTPTRCPTGRPGRWQGEIAKPGGTPCAPHPPQPAARTERTHAGEAVGGEGGGP